MNRYRKLIAAATGLFVLLAGHYLSPEDAKFAVEVFAMGATLFGVWYFPNEPQA